MGDHMPVHLGSMPMSVRAAIDALALGPRDVAILNDPFHGNTHLPDITLVAPVFTGKDKQPSWYVASRAHHADVGGAFAGSMGIAREIYEEGLRIPPVHLVRDGEIQEGVRSLLLANVRTPAEREGDLRAQLAACHTGDLRLRELTHRYGAARLARAASELLDYSEEMMRAFLQNVPRGTFCAEDFLDDDGISEGPVMIRCAISFQRDTKKMATVDFTGSSPQVAGSVNAVEAITYSACYYVFRCVLHDDVPATAGLMRPIEVIAPAGSVVNARAPAAVAGGNVETSQRIVDVLLAALGQAMPERIPAGSSGTMNNLTIGGMDPRAQAPFAYYETIAGGMGARATKAGVSATHTHMTNSLNTPAEALEYAYPFRVTEYSIRRGSGGDGAHPGGDGIVREIEVLTEAQVTLLADRRKQGPRGARGGADGAPGRTEIIRSDGHPELLASKASTRLQPGERVRIESPGGGGYGKARPRRKHS
jgi:N-methylhydantoinase B